MVINGSSWTLLYNIKNGTESIVLRVERSEISVVSSCMDFITNPIIKRFGRLVLFTPISWVYLLGDLLLRGL